MEGVNDQNQQSIDKNNEPSNLEQVLNAIDTDSSTNQQVNADQNQLPDLKSSNIHQIQSSNLEVQPSEDQEVQPYEAEQVQPSEAEQILPSNSEQIKTSNPEQIRTDSKHKDVIMADTSMSNDETNKKSHTGRNDVNSAEKTGDL